jgi:NodT family efflux transporter outer membrane factor (OMF) lipoprotein
MTIGPHSCSSTSARIAVAGRIHGSQIAAAVLLVLAGCASSPLTAVPPSGDGVELPATWSATKLHTAGLPDTAAAPLTDWWLRFDDPLLDTLVRRALQANTSVKTAQAALLQAQALRDEAAAALWPTLGATASAQQGTADGHRTGNVVQAGVSASWVPDVFGAHRSALAASRATVQASAASAGDVQGTIAAEVALSYVVLRSGQARLAIAGDNLASQEETLQITQWRQQAGLATLLDVEQQRAAVEQTRALVPAQQAGIAQAQHALAVLCGRPPGGLADLLTPPRAVPQDTADFTPDIPAQTLRQRADVRAAEYQVSAAWARVAQADAARFPGFALGGSLGSSAATLGALTQGASIVGSLLASVSLPLFDAGAARAEVRAQQAAFEQARLAYQATVLAALQDVEDALAALRGDRARLLSLRTAAASAAEAAKLARQQYASGLVDFQTVLLTQRTQLGTQDSVASANADVSSDQIRLFKALGGGWREDGDLGAPTAAALAARTSPP